MFHHSNFPAFSAVIPLFNKEATVERALRSILNQTVPDVEIVVVDDGSTDQGLGVVRAIADPRIRIVRQEHAGASAARNRGVRESQSDWVAFLDADDEWQPDHLEILSGLRRDHPECDVAATRYLRGVEGEDTRPAIVQGLAEDWTGVMSDYFSVAARSDPPLWTGAVSVSRKALESIGGFPAGVVAGEDLLTWARLAARGRVAYTMKPTAIFRQTPGHVYRDRPSRMPDRDDIVGRGLEALLQECRLDQRYGLKQYIALWHKMRASVYLRFGKRGESLKETGKAIRYDPWGWKLYGYLVLTLLPSRFQYRLFQESGSRRR